MPRKKVQDIVHEDEGKPQIETPISVEKFDFEYQVGDFILGEHVSGVKVTGEITEIRSRDGQAQYLLKSESGRYYWCLPISESAVTFTEWGSRAF